MSFLRSRWFTLILLAAILLLALALRTYNVDWAEGQLPHPDERSTIAFYAPTIRWPTEPGALWDAHRSTLNPLWDVNANQRRSFTYGHFPLYLLVGIGNIVPKLAPMAESMGLPERYVLMMRIANGSPGFAWVGRVIMALADSITVLYLYLLGRRIYNRHVGLLAAALGAFTVLQIQLAHFFAVDPISTTFTVATIYHALRMIETRTWRQAILTGIMAALAIASKFSAAPIMLAPLVAGVILTYRQRQQSQDSQEAPGLLLAFTAMAVAGIVFAITSPYVLLDFENFRIAVLEEQGAMVRGIADMPFTRQYRGTLPYLYFIEQQVRWGMGWFLGLLGWFAFGWAIIKALWQRAEAGELLVLSWLLPYFLITGSFLAKFNRYMVPVVPFLSLLGAGMLWSLASWIVRRRRQKPDIAGQSHADLQMGPLVEPTSDPPEESDDVDAGTLPVEVDAPVTVTTAEPLAATQDDTSARSAVSLFWALGLIVLIPTMFWALAFVNGVYRTEHPFLTASEWMYENVPDGSVWITEHWEEGMPLHLPIPEGSPGAHGWRNVVMPMYEEDTPGKYEILKGNLREGDFYVLATKRLYGALPQLPQRYPMSIKFYDLLFAEQLGYELVADFTSYPRLLGLQFPDQSADESFWVYDHPRTLIYQKVRDLSDAEWEQLLGGSWESAIPGYTGQRPQDRGLSVGGTVADEGPTLLLEQGVDELPDIGRVDWAPWRYRSWLALMVWWLILLGIQLLLWPITFTVFSRLRDRGYGFGRALGLILAAWLAWIVPALGLLNNSILPVLLALIPLLIASVVLWRQHRQEIREYVATHRTLLLVSEGVFTGAFLLFVLIRLLNPDLWQPWQGGEKFMEFAFLNAVTRTPAFPPYDPYFAGGTMNYYYYGYQILAWLIKLSGISASIAFNLAIPTLFSLTAAGVFSLVYSIAPRRQRTLPKGFWWRRGLGAGLVGVLFVAIMGNLEGGLIIFRQIGERSASTFESGIPGLQAIVRAMSGLGQVVTGQMDLPTYNFWTPSRVIPFTINEFPFWSFLFADLHPHMMGIPFTVLFLGLAYNLVAGYGQGWAADGRIRGAFTLLLLPLTLGAIGAINTWDLPTYLGIGIVAWLIREWKGFGTIRIIPTAIFILGLGALAYLLYLPFYSNYTTVFDTGIGLTYIKTGLGPWLRIWGLFIFLALSYVLVEIRHNPGDVSLLRWLSGILQHFDRAPRFLDHFSNLVRAGWDLRFGQILLLLVALFSVVLAYLGYAVVALIALPLSLLFVFLFRRTTSAEGQFQALLFFTGLLVLIGVEVFYLKDFLCGCGEGLFAREHGDWYRMNTLFKFYSQVWVLLGIATAAALPSIWQSVSSWMRGWRTAWTGLFWVLLAFSLVFPLLGTVSRVEDRFPGARPGRNTLDGMAFMTVGQYSWPTGANQIQLNHDYDAIRWLQDNVTGTPVLAEAPASWYNVDGQNHGYDYYRAGGLRASSLTGLPTFLGQHQGEQRYGYQTGPREQAGREFFETTDIARLRQLIETLNVGYVYVGQLERTLFSTDQLRKFDALVELGEAEIVYQNDGVTIYRLLPR